MSLTVECLVPCLASSVLSVRVGHPIIIISFYMKAASSLAYKPSQS